MVLFLFSLSGDLGYLEYQFLFFPQALEPFLFPIFAVSATFPHGNLISLSPATEDRQFPERVRSEVHPKSTARP